MIESEVRCELSKEVFLNQNLSPAWIRHSRFVLCSTANYNELLAYVSSSLDGREQGMSGLIASSKRLPRG